MARGWESKSVEAQQQEAADTNAPAKPRLTREQADRLREEEHLRLSLLRVQEQLKQNPGTRHRTMLEQAKADLQARIERLGM